MKIVDGPFLQLAPSQKFFPKKIKAIHLVIQVIGVLFLKKIA
jgi:hypothetical protein